jgi:hypothetical protein
LYCIAKLTEIVPAGRDALVFEIGYDFTTGAVDSFSLSIFSNT